MRLTIAVPADHTDIANHYAMTLGYSEADGQTYRNPSWADVDGNLYALASLIIGEGFIGNATSPLPRPAWDTEEVIDMAKASQAQALVVLWTPDSDGPPPIAVADKITAVLGMEGIEAVAAMGLVSALRDTDLLA
ncbi:hypothetical protein [Sulfitobacter sp. M22]|uniref:hypothetical protein n=1 Tax=Sulfitobacter sp. M22 TaxID=2675332 RepID=UPI001F251752|nr:hypothetical protein [Sulfitobacter sp. M22]MCF7725790.1 hypothetical protein [Sulfitobacter sp. M22]